MSKPASVVVSAGSDTSDSAVRPKSETERMLEQNPEIFLDAVRLRASRVFFLLLAGALHTLFVLYGIYRWIQRLWHLVQYQFEAINGYHHRSSQLVRNDVVNLKKVPRHIAVILNLRGTYEAGGGIGGLLNDAQDVASWCVGSGAAELSIYERTGALKRVPLEEVLRAVQERLASYFGPDSVPAVSVSIPNTGTIVGDVDKAVLRINLLSATDGRTLLVELTRTFADLAVQKKLDVKDLTLDFIDRELKSLVGPEPDLLIMFTPSINLQGYPPWHLRVTELFYLRDNSSVSYFVFLRALKRFSNVKINLGK